MKRSRFSEERIIGLLQRNESGVTVSQLCREIGISESTFYQWKSKFGGMNVCE
ncbi:MAG: transposase, partial [Abditibacteriaceae bacterium]